MVLDEFGMEGEEKASMRSWWKRVGCLLMVEKSQEGEESFSTEDSEEGWKGMKKSG